MRKPRAGCALVGLCVVLCALGLGCGPSAPAAAAAAAPKRQSSAVRPLHARATALPAPRKGAEVAVAAGVVVLGSKPGTAMRNPGAEADLVSVQLPAFSIDALPFPNAPGEPARTNVSREEAGALCAADGKRLCSELEWERACKGTRGAVFTTGDRLELATCRKDPASCRSDEGTFGLGIALREWTASDAPAGIGHALRTAVIRGAALDAELPAHRCAARTGATADSRGTDLGFRCCRGPSPSAAYPVEPEHAFTRALGFDTAAARAELAQVPQLAGYAKSFTPFTDGDADVALRRGGASRTGITLWQFVPSSVAWSPIPGEELHVLSGRTDQGALLAVLHAYADGRVAHAASTLVAEPDATLAVGGSAEHASQLIFTTCYGCPGEGGTIRFGDDARVELAYR